MKKLIRISTVPTSLNIFLKGHLSVLAKSYEVIVVSSPGQELDIIREREGVRTIVVPMKRHISIGNDVVSLLKLILLFIRERPDIVHSMTPKAGLLAMVAAFITRVPIRIHTFTGLVFPTSKGMKRRVLIFMDKIICFCATYINPEGNGVANDIKENKISKKILHIIANGNVRGVDLEWYDRTEEVVEQAEKIRVNECFTFCYVGRLVSDKGINELVNAFEILSGEYQKVRLILVGGMESDLDPLHNDTLEKIKNNKQIIYMGRQPDIRPYMASSDAFVLPSYREGFPNVVLEAGALGLASIVTDINGSNEIIINGKNGEIIPPRDTYALYEKMKEWVKYPERVRFMAENAREIVAIRYNQKLILDALLAEYRRLEENIRTNI